MPSAAANRRKKEKEAARNAGQVDQHENAASASTDLVHRPALGIHAQASVSGQRVGATTPNPVQTAAANTTPQAILREHGSIYAGVVATAAEDNLIKSAEEVFLEKTKGAQKFFNVGNNKVPGRQGYGFTGTQIILYTNYLEIEVAKPKAVLYRYNVTLDPASASRGHRRRMFDAIFQDLNLLEVVCATDYSGIIVTTSELENFPSTMKKIGYVVASGSTNAITTTTSSAGGQSANQPGSNTEPQHGPTGQTFEYKLTYDKSYRLRDEIKTMVVNPPRNTSPELHSADHENVLHMLNIIMLKAPNSNQDVQVTAQNKCFQFSPLNLVEERDLGIGLHAVRGYYSSVRPAISRLLLNLNVCTGVFYKPQQMVQTWSDIQCLSEQDRAAFVEGLKVRVKFFDEKGNVDAARISIKTIARVTNLDAHAAKRTVNRREISVFDYYRSLHVSLQSPSLPVLNVSKTGKPYYIPMEVCEIVERQQYRRLTPSIPGARPGDQPASKMIDFSARFPNVNAMSIAGVTGQPGNGVRLMRLAASDGSDPQLTWIKRFGLAVDPKLITVPGRILPAPSVKYKLKEPNRSRGGWFYSREEFTQAANLGKWRTVTFNDTSGSIEPYVAAFEDALKPTGLVKGATRDACTSLTLGADRKSDDKILDAYFEQAANDKVKLVLVILPQKEQHLYARIKFYGDVRHGVLTQCCTRSTFEKQESVFDNLAIKMNTKLGGTNHTVDKLLDGPFDKTMIVGIDVTHPSPGSAKNAPSIACVVASKDKRCGQWPGSIRIQQPRQEMVTGTTTDRVERDHHVNDLTDMVVERLELWRVHNNNTFPSQIIVYRDGVSEGQYALVLEKELPSLKTAFEKTYGKPAKFPKLAIVVVGKRHHTRFYPTTEGDADTGKKGSFNTMPGTIVDRGIGGTILQEFWLQAHQAIKGTARPAHYVVIKNDIIALTPDALQQLTHRLCWTFGRASKAVSVCPPVYYADLLATRARCYLHEYVNEGGSGSEFNWATAEWSGSKVHDNVKGLTWYL